MEKRHKSIVYRLYPNKLQESQINNTFVACSLLWNLILGDNIQTYKETGECVFIQPSKYKNKYPFLNNIDAMALSNERLNVIRAFQRLWRKKSKFPKFKSKSRIRRSYTTSNCDNTIRIEGNKIRLPKYGFIRAKIHRLPKDDWKIKCAVVFQNPDEKYYISILCEYEVNKPTYKNIDANNSIGLDYKSNGLYMDSNGNIGTDFKPFRKNEKRLAKEEHKLMKKKRGSNRYKKQQKRVAKVYKQITNQRKDNLHKISRMLVEKFDIISVETLYMHTIAKRFNLGKSTMDNAYSMFINFLTYKAEDLEHILVKINRKFASSQICSHCGNKQPMPVGVQIYSCQKCGFTLDRDRNASINIDREGVRLAKKRLGITP